jgi:hypothetical protein
MVFDSARRAIVLFGGVADVALFQNRVAGSLLLSDTWEHTEIDPPATAPNPNPNPPSGSQPNVISLALVPSSAASGQNITANIILDQPALAGGTVVALAFLTQAAYQASLANPASVNASTFTVLGQMAVAPGAVMGQYQFLAPSVSPQQLVVLAEASGTTQPANATLTIL